MTKVLDNSLTATFIGMSLLLIVLIAISGITSLVTFIAIVYVALGGFLVGHAVGHRGSTLP